MDKLASSRREALRNSGVLSATAFAVLAGAPMAAASARDTVSAADVSTLNVALSLEHEGIAAYQIGAESGLLSGAALNAAVLFQGHHKGHRDELSRVIRELGGTPVGPKTAEEYFEELDIANAVKGPNDVLLLAQRLELGAASAYLGIIPSLEGGEMKHLAARIAADESSHYAILSTVLGQSLATQPFIYG